MFQDIYEAGIDSFNQDPEIKALLQNSLGVHITIERSYVPSADLFAFLNESAVRIIKGIIESFGAIKDALLGIRECLYQVGTDTDVEVATTKTVQMIRGVDSLVSPAVFAYDNVSSISELVPKLREAFATERVLQ